MPPKTPKTEAPVTLNDRQIEHDGFGLIIDDSEAEGEPFDFSEEATERARAEDPNWSEESDEDA